MAVVGNGDNRRRMLTLLLVVWSMRKWKKTTQEQADRRREGRVQVGSGAPSSLSSLDKHGCAPNSGARCYFDWSDWTTKPELISSQTGIIACSSNQRSSRALELHANAGTAKGPSAPFCHFVSDADHAHLQSRLDTFFPEPSLQPRRLPLPFHSLSVNDPMSFTCCRRLPLALPGIISGGMPVARATASRDACIRDLELRDVCAAATRHGSSALGSSHVFPFHSKSSPALFPQCEVYQSTPPRPILDGHNCPHREAAAAVASDCRKASSRP